MLDFILAALFCGFLVAPISAYMVAKFGTTGYFKALEKQKHKNQHQETCHHNQKTDPTRS